MWWPLAGAVRGPVGAVLRRGFPHPVRHRRGELPGDGGALRLSGGPQGPDGPDGGALARPALYEDARAFLEAAPAPVYLVTNSDDHFVEEALRRYGLPWPALSLSQAARYAKPRPEIFRFALERYGLRPGDRPPGGLAGRGCGDAPRSGYPGPLAQPEGEAGPSGCGGCGRTWRRRRGHWPPCSDTELLPNCP
ncbi:MAG: HAD family hydrolase [Intestinimonas sp.]